MTEITEKQLIKQLAQLKKIKPSADWIFSCRETLSKEIGLTKEKESKPLSLSEVFSFFRQLNLPKLSFRPVFAIWFLVFGLIFGSGITALAMAKDSLPGEHLYPVKIALEQARLLAITSNENKAKIQSEMTVLRLEEINRIMNKSESSVQKQQRIEEAVINLQKQLLTISSELPKINKSETSLEVVRKIDANAVQIEKVLSQAKASFSDSQPSQNLTDKMREALDTADDTSTKALELIVRQQDENSTTMSQEEIIAKIDEKIQRTEEKLKLLAETVNNSDIGNRFPINAVIILDETDRALEQAKASLEQNDTTGALKTFILANEMAKSAEKIVESITESMGNQETTDQPDDNANASSTSSTIEPATTTQVVPAINSSNITNE